MQKVEYLEDLVIALVDHKIRLASYDHAKVNGIYHQITGRNLALTDRQAALVTKWVQVYKRQLSNKNVDVSPLIEDPKIRLSIRAVNRRRKAWIENNELRFQFPMNDNMVAELYNLRRTMKGAFRAVRGKFDFNKTEDRWEVDLNSQNITQCVSFFGRYNFELSPEVQGFKTRIEEIYQCPDRYLPVVREDRKLYNVSDAVQEASLTLDRGDDRALLEFARAWGLGVSEQLFKEIENRHGYVSPKLWFYYQMFCNCNLGQVQLFQTLEQAEMLPALVAPSVHNSVDKFSYFKLLNNSIGRGLCDTKNKDPVKFQDVYKVTEQLVNSKLYHLVQSNNNSSRKPRCIILTNEIFHRNEGIDLDTTPVIYFKSAPLFKSVDSIVRYGYMFSARAADFSYVSAAKADRGPERLLVTL